MMIAKILIPGALVLATFASAAGYATYSTLTSSNGTAETSVTGETGGCCHSLGGCPSSQQPTACHADDQQVDTSCCAKSNETTGDNEPAVADTSNAQTTEEVQATSAN